jgi:hypothetical protein
MSRIGQWVAEDMAEHPELYDPNDDREPDFGGEQ